MALPKLDTPIYETKLISNGKTVKFRPFLVKEQKLFLMAMESNDPKDIVNTIKQVLTNCILNDEINVEELSSFDLEYLFMQLRAKSVGEIVNLKYTCNNVVKMLKVMTKHVMVSLSSISTLRKSNQKFLKIIQKILKLQTLWVS